MRAEREDMMPLHLGLGEQTLEALRRWVCISFVTGKLPHQDIGCLGSGVYTKSIPLIENDGPYGGGTQQAPCRQMQRL